MHLGPILSPNQPIKDNRDNGIKTVIYLLSHNVTIVFVSYLIGTHVVGKLFSEYRSSHGSIPYYHPQASLCSQL